MDPRKQQVETNEVNFAISKHLDDEGDASTSCASSVYSETTTSSSSSSCSLVFVDVDEEDDTPTPEAPHPSASLADWFQTTHGRVTNIEFVSDNAKPRATKHQILRDPPKRISRWNSWSGSHDNSLETSFAKTTISTTTANHEYHHNHNHNQQSRRRRRRTQAENEAQRRLWNHSRHDRYLAPKRPQRSFAPGDKARKPSEPPSADLDVDRNKRDRDRDVSGARRWESICSRSFGSCRSSSSNKNATMLRSSSSQGWSKAPIPMGGTSETIRRSRKVLLGPPPTRSLSPEREFHRASRASEGSESDPHLRLHSNPHSHLNSHSNPHSSGAGRSRTNASWPARDGFLVRPKLSASTIVSLASDILKGQDFHSENSSPPVMSRKNGGSGIHGNSGGGSSNHLLPPIRRGSPEPVLQDKDGDDDSLSSCSCYSSSWSSCSSAISFAADHGDWM